MVGESGEGVKQRLHEFVEASNQSRYELSLKVLGAELTEMERLKRLVKIDYPPSYNFEIKGVKTDIFTVEFQAPTGFVTALLALDSDKQLVGHRRQAGVVQNDLVSGEPYLHSEGYVIVAKRGQGLGHALSLATDHRMQAMANELQTKVVWQAKNKNLLQLELDRKRVVNFPSGVVEGFLQNSEQEQERWQSIYGDKGLLGLRKLVKRYNPDPNYKSSEPGHALLAQREGNKYKFIQSPEVVTEKDSEKHYRQIFIQIQKRASNAH